MIPRLSYTNIAIVGLLQIGTIVFGVLSAGAACKLWSGTGVQIRYIDFTSEYGFLFLAVPLVWITVAMILQGRDNDNEFPEYGTFYTGVFILIVLVIVAWNAGVSPMFRGLGDGGCGLTLGT